MKKSKFTESQITGAIKAYEAGKDVQQICRELKINAATFYNWKKKYSGMDAELLRQSTDSPMLAGAAGRAFTSDVQDCAALPQRHS